MEPKTITLPKTQFAILQYSLLAVAFLIPLFISGPQLLTGTIVNTLLFLFALLTPSKKFLPIVVLPSIGALLNGLIFGRFTMFLLYFLPFIWMGNYILVGAFIFLIRKYSSPISVIASSLLKSAVLFFTAYIFVNTKVVPMQFLQFMGLFQLYTALLGGVVAYAIYKIVYPKV